MNQEQEYNVLSEFDGMSCGQLALLRTGKKITNYFASEIDKYAVQIAIKNFPNTKHLGDVTKIKIEELPKIHLFIGGSPCQGFSFAGKQLNFNDSRSRLFFEFAADLRFIQEFINEDVEFLLENVKMKKEYQDVISKFLGIEPIEINSSLLSAQIRKRLYWTNIKNISIPEDKNILLESVIENGFVDRDKSFCLDANYFKGTNARQYLCKSRRQIIWVIPEATKKGYVEVKNGDCIDLTFIKSKTRRGRLMIKKSNCLTAVKSKFCLVTNDWFRMLTPIEEERLQTLPDNYTQGVSNMQRYKMLGNGWTVDVISHIFKNLS